MPIEYGRLTCCVCGADLGDAEDPYRDPSCFKCIERENEEEWEAEQRKALLSNSDADYRDRD